MAVVVVALIHSQSSKVTLPAPLTGWWWRGGLGKRHLDIHFPFASTHPSSSSSWSVPSLQHQLFEVVVKDGVLDISEHQPDVLSVDGSGEVVVQWLLLLLATLFAKAFHQEALDISQARGIARELGEVVFDGHLLHLVLQQIRLVQEQYDGDITENPVVDDGLKNVEGLTQPVGLPVLHQHLQVLECRHDCRGQR